MFLFRHMIQHSNMPLVGARYQPNEDTPLDYRSTFCSLSPLVPLQAYAKLHGTYESINGGSVGEALVDLTGGCCEKISFTSGKELMDGHEIV